MVTALASHLCYTAQHRDLVTFYMEYATLVCDNK